MLIPICGLFEQKYNFCRFVEWFWKDLLLFGKFVAISIYATLICHLNWKPTNSLPKFYWSKHCLQRLPTPRCRKLYMSTFSRYDSIGVTVRSGHYFFGSTVAHGLRCNYTSCSYHQKSFTLARALATALSQHMGHWGSSHLLMHSFI